MDRQSSWWDCVRIGCAVVLFLWAGAGIALADATGVRPGVSMVSVTTEVAPGWGPLSHRLTTRAEHTIDRFTLLLADVGAFWLWVGASILAFLVIAAVSSVADTHMLAMRHEPPGAVARYLGYGIRTFFLIVLDRRTPYGARMFLVAALVYWLIPFDLIADTSVLPGFVDDVVVTVAAVKGFVYLCPAALVAGHARAVEARGRNRSLPSPPSFLAR